eukprot:GGOE01065470.1.p1 GENE.GGOE01065470.1~~GGOE01065470.1.p1  ORF type:complete len:519 (-),score=147.96 GGOE01065470.1:203-1759(-)
MATNLQPPLPRTDPDWGRAEFLVRLGLQSASVEMLAVHPVSPPNAEARFRAAHKRAAILDSFLFASELVGSNSLDHILKRGGRLHLTEQDPLMLFRTGTIPVQRPANNQPRRQLHELLLCRIAVYHPIVLERTEAHQPIPPGYDCIKLQDMDPAVAVPTEHYYHEYLLATADNVLPMHLVSFTFDPDADARKRNPLCEQCEATVATVYCLQDDARLCDRCDHQLHSKSKVLEKHGRVPVAEVQGNLTLSRCRQHPDMPVQFYDPIAHEAVCVHCKMVGSHSAGEKARHALVTINDAYTENVAALLQEQDIVGHRQQRIASQLQAVDDRLQNVHANAAAVEQQLRDSLLRIFDKLQATTQAKLHLLLSDEAELRRRLQYYDWLDAFLRYQKDLQDPVDFLASCRHHFTLLQEAPQHAVECAPIVLTDCQLTGDLDLETVPISTTAAAAASHGGKPLRTAAEDDAGTAPEPYAFAPAPPYASSPRMLHSTEGGAQRGASYTALRPATHDLPLRSPYTAER